MLGRHGQLARSLAERAPAHGLVTRHAGRPDLDLCDSESVRRAILGVGASTVINATAYTAVDQAEDEPEAAWRLNVDAPRSIAQAVGRVGARLIHVSSDYVFGAIGDHPRTETDTPDPMSVYGRTKLAGEIAIRELLPRSHAIVRTSWVYSPFGNNFVRTMLRLAESHAEVRVVSDQIGNPTSALDLADGLLTMAASWEQGAARGLGGLYHLAGTGSTSWAGFAREIFALSAVYGGPSAVVNPIATSEWRSLAPRPANGQLNSSLFTQVFDYQAPNWQSSLATVVVRLVSNGKRNDQSVEGGL